MLQKKVSKSINVMYSVPANRVSNLISRSNLHSRFYSHDIKIKHPTAYWGDLDNQKQFLESASKHFRINTLEDWYNVTHKEFLDFGGRGLLDKYNWSTSQLLSSLYPEHDWLPWKFRVCPSNYWEDVNNQIQFVNWAGKELKIKEMSDWYNVKIEEFVHVGGSVILMSDQYKGSLYLLLSTLYPQFKWELEKFKNFSPSYWNNVDNRRKFLKSIANKLNVKDMDDWYQVTEKDFVDVGGNFLLTFDSLPNLVVSSFPEYDWLSWKFEKFSWSYWNKEENQRKFVNWAGKQLGVNEMSDWYKVSAKELSNLGGEGLLEKYKGSIINLLSSVYPEYNWLPWKFAKTPQSFWDDVNNQKKYMKWAENELNIKEMQDWYKITTNDFVNIGGAPLLKLYHSLPSLLSFLYPGSDLLPWKFVKSKSFKSDENSRRKFLEWAGGQLGVKEMSDWYNVSPRDIKILGGSSLLSNHTLPQILQESFPDFNWEFDTKILSSKNKKSQYLLKSFLKEIFPQEDFLEEYRHPNIELPSGSFLELDFYCPKLEVAFEFQGEQHYKNISLFHTLGSLEQSKQRDLTKNALCNQNGITLIEVPYWWDRKYESLYATIYNKRPDLFDVPPTGQPIPAQAPVSETDKSDASVRKSLMTATEWDSTTMDPTGWIMSEKYDGMRLYWNGSDFYSRQGNKLKLPEFVTKQFPNIAIDGELWTQYKLYQDAVNLCKIESNEEKWKKATFWVFDAPNLDLPFEQRITHLRNLKNKGKLPSIVQIVDTVVCKGHKHLKEYCDSIIAKGGEGVMLREPHSVYQSGRSLSLRKYKPFFDTEVKVVENNYPHGFNCIQTNGKSLFVGYSGNQNQGKRVKPGSVITVQHQGANIYGTLLYPKFYRERTDLSWDEIIKT